MVSLAEETEIASAMDGASCPSIPLWSGGSISKKKSRTVAMLKTNVRGLHTESLAIANKQQSKKDKSRIPSLTFSRILLAIFYTGW